MASEFSEEIPRDVSVEWVAYRYRDLHRRVRNIETSLDRYDPAVVDIQLKTVIQEQRAIKRAFYTFAFGTVGSAVLFAFTVFALLGKHP